jgi:outer membrane autotransporter protein
LSFIVLQSEAQVVHADSASWSGTWVTGLPKTKTPNIPTSANVQQSSFLGAAAGPYDYNLDTFYVGTTGTYSFSVTVTRSVETTWLLTGTFTPNNSSLVTPTSDFFAGIFANTTPRTEYLTASLTAGTEYSVLVAYGAAVSGTTTYAVDASGPGGICFGSCVIDTSQSSFDQNSVQAQGGTILFNGGTFKPTATTSLSATLFLQSTGGTVDSAATQTTTLSGVISGTGMLTKTGNGILVLSGANTYDGGTTADGGTLVISADDNLGANGTSLTLKNGTEIKLTDSFSFSHPVTVSGDPTFDVATGKTVSFGAAITGSGDIVKTGAGTLQLNGASNSYTGATTVDTGKLEVASSGTITKSSGLVNSATFAVDAGGSATFKGTVVNNAGATLTTAGTLTATGGLSNAGTVTASGTLTADVTNSGTFTVAGALHGIGTLTQQAGTVDLGGKSVSVTGFVLTDGTIDDGTLKSTSDYALESGAVSAALAGTVGATKTGSGTVAFSGANTYTGATTVSTGTLEVTGTGAITKSSGLANSATFQVDAGGSATFTGAVVNNAGATLTTAGTLTTTGGLSNAGTVTAAGTLNADVTNSGTFAATGALSVIGTFTQQAGMFDLGGNSVSVTNLVLTGGTIQDGTLTVTGTYTLQSGTITATLAGSGALTIASSGTVTLTDANGYTGGTLVQAGTVAIGNAQALGSGTVTLDEGTTLAFTSAMTLTNNLAFPQAGDPIIDTGSNSVTISGSISGIGDLTKIGSGTLDLTGSNSYTGATDVQAGTLLVDGSTASSVVTVESGATLGGAGTIGGLVALSGATIAPGVATPYSTLNVAGNVTFAAGSLYQVQIAANGQTDAIVATGTASLSGGTVSVLAGSGTYSTATVYRILTAQGGRTGEFDTLTTSTDLAFLSPTLTYDSTGVDLAFKRTSTFAAAAATANERAAATAIEGLGANNTLYNTVLSQSVAGARQAFDATSGEFHASAATAGMEDAGMARDAILDHMSDADRAEQDNALQALGGFAPPPLPDAARSYAPVTQPAPSVTLPRFALWGQAFGDFGHNGGNGNAASLSRSMAGFVAGGDSRVDAVAFDAWHVGFVAGYTTDDIRSRDRASSGTYQSAFGGVYAFAQYGAVAIRLGTTAGGTWTDTQRTVTYPGFYQPQTTAHSVGDVFQGFGEIGYKFGLSRGYVEPVLAASAIHIDQGSFRESPGTASLTGAGRGYDVGSLTIGLRAEATPFADMPLTAHGFLGYRNAFGDVNPKALLSFEAGSSPFVVAGTPLDRNTLVTEIGLEYKTSSAWTVGVGYSGQYGARDVSNSVQGRAEFRF